MAAAFPPLPDSATLRTLAGSTASIAGIIAYWTKTKVDDTFVAALKKIVESDEAWATVYGLLATVWPGSGPYSGVDYAAVRAKLAEALAA